MPTPVNAHANTTLLAIHHWGDGPNYALSGSAGHSPLRLFLRKRRPSAFHEWAGRGVPAGRVFTAPWLFREHLLRPDSETMPSHR